MIGGRAAEIDREVLTASRSLGGRLPLPPWSQRYPVLGVVVASVGGGSWDNLRCEGRALGSISLLNRQGYSFGRARYSDSRTWTSSYCLIFVKLAFPRSGRVFQGYAAVAQDVDRALKEQFVDGETIDRLVVDEFLRQRRQRLAVGTEEIAGPLLGLPQ
jgi:hypothetical protein